MRRRHNDSDDIPGKGRLMMLRFGFGSFLKGLDRPPGLPAVTATMTSWSFTSGGTNFQLISGSFSPAASSQIRVEDMTAGGYLYATAWGPSTTIFAVAIAALTAGRDYKFQVRAYTGSVGYGDLPWVQYGVQWTQPSKLDPAEEQSG